MKTKLLSGLVLLGAFALILVLASPSYRQGEPGMAGRTAPGFTFDLNGQPASLSGLAGKVVVLNFWATWCPPCVDEMPSLNRLHQKISPQGGMVLGVSVDDDAQAYQRFLQQYGIAFPNHLDPSRKIAAEYGSSMYPETYILSVSKSGKAKILRKIIGPQDWDRPEILEYLRTAIAEIK